MSGSDPKYNVAVQASAAGTPELKELISVLKNLDSGLKTVNHDAQKVAASTGFGRITGGIKAADGAANRLTGTLGGLHGTLSSLFPPLAALGGAAAFGGMFTMVAKFAASTREATRQAKLLGITLPDLEFSKLGLAARASLTPMEAVYGGMRKLQVGIGNAAMGRDKPLAKLFKDLGIGLRDSKGNIRGVASVMDDLFKAFRVNENETTRGTIARMLFGRSGQELINMLTLTREEMQGFGDDMATLGYRMPQSLADSLIAYDKSWRRLEFASSQLKKQIAAELAPILKPVVDDMTAWVAANRDWVATGIAEATKEFATAVRSVDWAGNVREAKEWAVAGKEAWDSIGGLKTVIIALVAIKTVGWAAGFVADLRILTTAAIAAYAVVGPLAIAITTLAALGYGGFKVLEKGWDRAFGDPGAPQPPPTSVPRIPGVGYDWDPDSIPNVGPAPPPDSTVGGGDSRLDRGQELRRRQEEIRRWQGEIQRGLRVLPSSLRPTLLPTLPSGPRGPLDPAGRGFGLSEQKIRLEIEFNGLPEGVTVTTRTNNPGVMPPTIIFGDVGRAFSPMPGAT